MKLTEFSYSLPDQAISRVPAEPRDSARLLVSRSADELIDSTISSLSDFISEGDVLVVNNTKVLPARIPVTRTSGGAGEVFLLHRIDSGLWEALVRPSAKISEGEIVTTQYEVNGEKCSLEIGQNNGEGHRVVRFVDCDDNEVIHAAGQVPLPPYLGDVDIPIERYQTMFARDEESVAAPTAGLHFTPAVKDSLKKIGCELVEVTLHVGVGTFRPITTENIEDHVMHEETYYVDEDVWNKVRKAKENGNKVIAVGTTSLRTLESVAKTQQLRGDTDLFCHGDYPFQVVDVLLTNFHQPQSSLLVLLDAFIGSRWRDLYAYALENQYRFLSFGDAMLVARKGLYETQH